jgi:predicted HTH domain antitoxin
MALIIRDSELQQANLTAEELKFEIAIMLYQRGKLSSGKARKFANMSSVIICK